MFADEPIRSYLERVASGEPTPGGGSVAALTAALGSSLVAMVANFTVGREKFKAQEDEVRAILEEEVRIRRELVDLVQEDAVAYAGVARAYRLPRSTAGEKEVRRKAVREALTQALRVPLRIMELSHACIRLAERLLERGNPNLISDVGVAASLSAAAMECGWLNVEINLASLRDDGVRSKTRTRMEPLLKGGREAAAAVWRKVEEEVVR